jgi:hypothetical protein
LNDQDDHGDTCLHIASRKDKYKHVEWLLGNGADPSMTNSKKETAWEVALKHSSFNAIGIFAFEETGRRETYKNISSSMFGAQWHQVYGGNNVR